MKTLTTLALALFPAAALAAPPLFNVVPEWDMAHVAPNARLTAASSRVDGALGDVDARKADITDERIQLKEARQERKDKFGRVMGASKEWRTARRAGDVAATDLHHGQLVRRADAWLDAQEHVRWHRLGVKAHRAELREARAEVSLAKAKRERQEALAVVDARPGEAIWYPERRFDRQVARIERVVDKREAAVDVAQGDAGAARQAWTAAVR